MAQRPMTVSVLGRSALPAPLPYPESRGMLNPSSWGKMDEEQRPQVPVSWEEGTEGHIS